MAENTQSEYKYYAFISYKREDEKWAQWLHKELERYEIPANIRKINKTIPKYIRPIFTDLYDISGGTLLNELRDALNSSKYLILICSKNTFNSQWINSELTLFLETHGEEFIIPIFIEENLPSAYDVFTSYKTIDAVRLGKTKTLVTMVVSRLIGVDYKLLNKAKGNSLHSLINYIKDYLKTIANSYSNDNLDNYIPQKNDTNIFISYRRIDGRDSARTIEQALSKYYNSIFFDYDSIQDGKFNIQILDAIYSCSDFVLVLSPKSMKRCTKKGDWVAREIRAAIKYNKHIIPLVIVDSNENFFQDWPRNFPKDLGEIKHLQRLLFRMDKYFSDSIKYLLQRLESKKKNGSIELESGSDDLVFVKIKFPFNYKLFIDDQEYVLTNGISELVKIPLKKGEYLIKICEVPDNNIILEEVLSLNQDKLYFKS